MPANRLIYQFAISPSPLWQGCLKSVQQYAKDIGVDYHLEGQMRLHVRPKNSHRSKEAVERHGGLPNLEKLAGLKLFDSYEQIALIDADVYVKPGMLSIFDSVPPDVDVAGVPERANPICDRYAKKLDAYEKAQFGPLDGVGLPFLNGGVMVYNRRFLRFMPNGAKAFWEQPDLERMINGEGAFRWQSEQVTLNYFLRKNQAHIRTLDWRWNYLYGMCKPGNLSSARFVHFILSAHLRGEDPEELVKDDRERARI